MGGSPDTWVTPDSDSSCNDSAAADTSAGKGRCMRRWGASPPAGTSAAADSLQELSLSGVTHVSGVPPIYLTATPRGMANNRALMDLYAVCAERFAL